MTSASSVIERVAARLVDRLLELERSIDAGNEAVWSAYVESAAALAAILPAIPVDRGVLLSTEAMAARLGISSKTLLRRRRQGLARPALQHGRLLRWRTDGNGF